MFRSVHIRMASVTLVRLGLLRLESCCCTARINLFVAWLSRSPRNRYSGGAIGMTFFSNSESLSVLLSSLKEKGGNWYSLSSGLVPVDGSEAGELCAEAKPSVCGVKASRTN